MRASSPSAAAVGLLLAAGVAWGQEPAPDLGAEAELHFEIGVDAYAKGDFQTALEHLLLSNRLAANHKVVFNIARAYEGLGKKTIAWTHYSDFAATAPNGSIRDEALEAMERLATEVALVRVDASVRGAAIYVDRRDLGQRGAVPRTIAVEPGNHRILIEAPGYILQEQAVEAGVGETVPVSLDLQPVNVQLVLDGAPLRAEVAVAGTGEVLGAANEPLRLPAGSHSLEIRANGFRSRVLDLTLVEGRPIHVSAALEPATGSLVLSSPIQQARVVVDGVPMGYAPDTLVLPVGGHSVVVEAEGYRAAQFDVVVRDSETTEVGVRMVPRTDVVAASRVSESLLDAPSTVVVISREDIRERGYNDLSEVVSDLPGFDAIIANGVTYLLAYQRGYRTPQTQRTLMLTDGKDDSLMWSQSAEMSRQFPFTDIERIEVLYGPASAVWGPNAFLGVVNVVTRDASDLAAGEHEAEIQAGGGSFSTGWVDGSARGRVGALGYAIAGRGFVSDEADLSGRWGFVSSQQLADERIWGPLLTGNEGDPFEVDGRPLGKYADPSEDYGVRGRLFLGDLEIGASTWTVSEGYGPYYATDRAQPVAPWNTSASRVWAQYQGELVPDVASTTLFQRKWDRISGTWAEADPDGDTASFVSLTEWNAPAAWWEARQLFHIELSPSVQAQAGGRWVRKELTKKYDVPGYWGGDSYYSSQPVDAGSAIFHSTDTVYEPPPQPLREMAPRNIAVTNDLGGFGQVIGEAGAFRFNAGVRYDLNSVFGGQLSPRGTAIWRFADGTGALKLVYGHAYQEPSARQLWGSWAGRGSNPRLEPETVDNGELVVMMRTADALVEGSIFAAHYARVLRPDSTRNTGAADVGGLEARARWTMGNPLPSTKPIGAYANYTFTMSRSTQSWKDGAWVDRPSTVGDIAPHKANAGVVVPMLGWASVHTRANLVSGRIPWAENPLREEDFVFPAYGLVDAILQVHGSAWEASLQVDNLFDAQILQPGPEAATAGDDFDARSLGYHNSALPLPGRAVFLTWTMDLAIAR